MESLAVLGGLAVLWLLVGPIVALVSATRAQRRVLQLSERLQALEALLAAAAPGAVPQPAAWPSTASQSPDPAAAATAPDEAESTDRDPATDAAAEDFHPEPPAPAPPRESLESRIGSRWSVIVGGLALALGAVFLVRYSIEQGLIGPGARIALGLLLSACLFAGGEWLRRRDRAADAPIFARADIPAILTGAGSIAAFASVYSAYALYGFIGAAAAFVLLTAAGLATLLLAVIHGPAIAALGAAGSYLAPFFVSSAEPAAMPVALHTLAVTASVYGMARLRGWRWLSATGIAGSVLWGLIAALMGGAGPVGAQLLLGFGLTAAALALLVAGRWPEGLRDVRPDPMALAALTAAAGLSLAYVALNPYYPPLAAGILLTGLLGGAAHRWPAVAPAALLAAGVAVCTTMLMPGADATTGTMRLGPLEWTVLDTAGIGRFALRTCALGLVIGLGAFLSAERHARAAPWSAGFFAAAGAAAPLAMAVIVYLRHAPLQTRPFIGVVALAMAAAFAAAAERLIARRPQDAAAPAPGFYAAGAVLALAFAIAVGLSRDFIPFGLSLGAAGIVWVALRRPVAILPWLAVACGAFACVALLAHPPVDAADIGARPLLNGLLLRVGLPAAAVLTAAEMLRRRRDGPAAAILQALGLALAALFVVLEIRHFANAGSIRAGAPGLGEQSALTLAALAFSLGLQRIAAQTRSAVYRGASLAAGMAGAAAIGIGHFVTANPLLTGEPVGTTPILNLLVAGYLLPALGAAWVAAAGRGVRPRWYVLALAALGLALAFAYVTLAVRQGFHGARLDLGPIGDAETWTYSAVWLLLAIALLGAGTLLRSATLRAASGLVLAAVICKVFLFDMSALTGVLRAASFLALGGTLIGVGRLYQRLLAAGRAKA